MSAPEAGGRSREIRARDGSPVAPTFLYVRADASPLIGTRLGNTAGGILKHCTRRALLVLAAAALAWASGPTTVLADPPDEPETVRFALYDIATITKGLPYFIPAGPLGTDYSSVSDGIARDEVAEESQYPYGSAEEVIELLKASVSPKFWEPLLGHKGALIVACDEGKLVVAATPAIHTEVAAFLAGLDADASVYVQMRAAPIRAADVAAWRQTQDKSVRPTLAGAIQMSLRVQPGARSVVSHTAEQALIRGADVHTVGERSVILPGTAIRRHGLQADVEAQLVSPHRVRLSVSASIARSSGPPLPPRALGTAELRGEQHPVWRTELVVDDGVWRLVGIDGGWSLFARADIKRTTRRVHHAHWLASPVARQGETIEPRRYPIQDLKAFHRSAREAWFAPLRSPSEAPPSPSEIGTPESVFPATSLVELIQMATGKDPWERGTIVEAYEHLIVRTTPAVHTAIESILTTVRNIAHVSVSTDVHVYRVPSALVPASPETLDAFLATQTPLHVSCVRAHPGNTNAANGARYHRYVETRELHVAGDTIVGTPQIAELSLGLAMQVGASVTSDGQQALLVLRLLDQTLLSERFAQTAFGPIALPHVRAFQGNATMRVPMNQPSVVFRADHASNTHFVTVTPRIGP